MESELDKIKKLLKAAYDHLNYCGWGDSWEHECSEGLRKELDEYFSDNYPATPEGGEG